MRRLDAAGAWVPVAAQPQAIPPGAELAREEPSRPANLVADLLVPLGQAVITGGLVGGLVAFLAARAGYHDWPALWAGLSLGISAAVWVALLGQTRRLLWSLERLTGRDLDGDRQVGKPSKQRLEVEIKQGANTRFVGSDWLGIEDDRLLAFAAGIHRGRGLTEGDWGKDTAVFPKGMPAWRAFRSKLLEAGLIAPLSGAANSSYTWTAAGRAFVARLVAYAKSGE